ncbi:HNH endonuclease [Phormidium sp. FACHB-1136]|uniref:HNH endonuclease n=1 Tax=Phormidium sp. FACHB-1136 TaxID=2692848 RepID=UPI001687F093|nr:HNH endonuclease [Phormidium sp. FACHB-1136]
MNKEIEFLASEFKPIDDTDIRVILKSQGLRLTIACCSICQFLVESGEEKITSRHLLQYMADRIEERGIPIIRRGKFCYINDPILNPKFDTNQDYKSPKGQFNPQGWLGALFTTKGFPSDFNNIWTKFIHRFDKSKGEIYVYSLKSGKRKIVEEIILKHKNQDSRLEDLMDFIQPDLNTETLNNLLLDPKLSKTEREAIVKSRVGQGKFRDDLEEYWESKCAVTGLSITAILRASHIKPWRDSNNHERLDSFNGLLLAPNLDSLFDKFLISFDEQGKIMISPKITDESIRLLGINTEMMLRTFESEHQEYLAYHRNVFSKGHIS